MVDRIRVFGHQKFHAQTVCEAAELGSPHEQFSTNAGKSANKLMKSKVGYKRSDLPVLFIQKKEELASEHKKQLEMAVVSRWKFRLRKQTSGQGWSNSKRNTLVFSQWFM